MEDLGNGAFEVVATRGDGEPVEYPASWRGAGVGEYSRWLAFAVTEEGRGGKGKVH